MTKLKILLTFFFLLQIVIISRLFFLQVLKPFNSNSVNYLTTKKIYPERGKIFDKNSQPLALNKATYLLYAEPKKIKDKPELIEKIDSILNVGISTLESRIDSNKKWVVIRDGLDKTQMKKIHDLNLEGLGFEDKFKRFYPEASLSAHILGFVGKNYDGEDRGYFGIEGLYDKDLSGFPGVIKSDKDILGLPIIIGTQQRLDPENGRDLYLTIDKSVQEIVKNKLKNGLETYGAKEGCIIVANPKTGEITALTCIPDFDVDKYYEFSEDYFKNSAISNLYEPGSIFKPLVMAAAIEEKKIKPDDFYNEDGPVNISGYTIRTWNNKYEGKISITRILEKSSNVGMVYVGQKLGQKNLYKYLKTYGFGENTGIDLQGESSGYIKPEPNWYDIDYATTTFGQGIAITPIQMLMAFSSLVNGGHLMKPYIVSKITSNDSEKKIAPKEQRKTISLRTSEIIKKMLISTVENGEVNWAKPKGYQIGGKTGTAQIPIQGHYDTSKTIASFIGFAPAKDPQFLVLVILREPKTSPWGSETAAPLFFEIAKDLIVYYNIAPE